MALDESDGGLHGRDTEEYGYNSVTYLFLSFIIWISSSALHFLLTPRLLCHVRAWPEHRPKKTFECTLDPSSYETTTRWQEACLGLWKIREKELRELIGDIKDKNNHWQQGTRKVEDGKLTDGKFALRRDTTLGEQALAAFDDEEGDL